MTNHDQTVSFEIKDLTLIQGTKAFNILEIAYDEILKISRISDKAVNSIEISQKNF